MVQIHYHPSGKPETDTSSIGLTFGGPPKRGRTSILMVDSNIDIPPGEANYLVKTSVTLARDVELASVFPHAHLLCRDMKLDATLPNGDVKHLIWIKNWDFNWQGGYKFENPLELPKGTRIDLAYTFDNSAANPEIRQIHPRKLRSASRPPMRWLWDSSAWSCPLQPMLRLSSVTCAPWPWII